MSEALQTLQETTLRDSRSAISLPESEDGAKPCEGQGLMQTDLFGREAAPARRSVAPESSKASKIQETYGRTSFGSSASAGLSECLANRLKLRLDTVGSTVYRQIWKRKVTPLGRVYWAHTARAQTTSGRDCTGWPTCSARDSHGAINHKERGYGMQLSDVPTMVGWLTPSANEDAAGNPGAKMQSMLGSQAKLAGSGQTPSPSRAGTGCRGVLNPAFSRWLMSFGAIWDVAAIRAYRCRMTKLRLSRSTRLAKGG